MNLNLRTAWDDARPVAMPFIIGLTLYSILGTVLYIALGKEETHLFLNAWHHPYTDQFFKYTTHAGHGLLPVAIGVLLLLVRYSWAIGFGVAAITMGVVAQTLKRVVFGADHRPAMFFPEGVIPHIEGVELMMNHSFPSGHAATGFTIYLMLAFFVKQRWASILFAVIALLVAFSRVYISQHFIQDTIVGSWIGLTIALLAYMTIIHPTEQDPSSKLNGRLLP